VPAVAVQEVAPVEVNCRVCPTVTLAVAGEMDWGAARETVAAADPPGPVAVTVTNAEEGIVDGAV